MKSVTGDEDFKTPILLLFMYSMLWIYEAVGLTGNLDTCGSLILTEPILFADNIFETIGNFCWFLMPAAIFFAALGQKQLFLKFTYLLGTLPLIMTAPIINKLGYKSLYVVKLLITFAVIMCLMKYLINTTDLYKKALKEKTGTDNQAAAPDSSQARRP